jgi:hypothetical protein
VRGIRIRPYLRILHPNTAITINLLFLPTSRLKHPIFPCPKLPNRVAAPWNGATFKKVHTRASLSSFRLAAARLLATVPFTCKTYVDGALAVRSPSRQSTRSAVCEVRLCFFSCGLKSNICAHGSWDDKRTGCGASQTCPFKRSTAAVQVCRGAQL